MGHVKIVEVLKRFGAKIDLRDSCGRDAFQWADLMGHANVKTALLDVEQDPALTPENLDKLLPQGTVLTPESKLSASEHLFKFARLGDLDECVRALNWQADPNFMITVDGMRVNPVREPTLLDEMRDLMLRLEEVANDPQISIPDVIVWVLCKNKRKAYLRIPVIDIFYGGLADPAASDGKADAATGLHFGAVRTCLLNLPKVCVCLFVVFVGVVQIFRCSLM